MMLGIFFFAASIMNAQSMNISQQANQRMSSSYNSTTVRYAPEVQIIEHQRAITPVRQNNVIGHGNNVMFNNGAVNKSVGRHIVPTTAPSPNVQPIGVAPVPSVTVQPVNQWSNFDRP